jgi:hypothetical protein
MIILYGSQVNLWEGVTRFSWIRAWLSGGVLQTQKVRKKELVFLDELDEHRSFKRNLIHCVN